VDPAAPKAAKSVVLDRPRLASLCRDLVQRTFVICDEVLSAAGVRAGDLDEVFVAGGASQLPMLQADLARYFGRTPRCDFDPGEVVAIGASIADEALLANLG
jgi:molecular chaperone DnaK